MMPAACPNDAAPEAKHDALLRGLRGLGRVLVAFSGGLDSTFLLHACREALGDGVLAVTLATPYMAGAEVAEAEELARDLGARHRLVTLPFPEILRENPPDRCYLCKRDLFSRLFELASGHGIRHVLDGTNVDDLGDHRPGMKALGELGVKSPLLTAGLTKRDIRELSRKRGLSSWDKPAAACLLSRIPHGTPIDEAELRRIDKAEDFLKGLGFRAVRLRSHGAVARIEVPREQVALVLEADRRHGIDAKLKELGYAHVAVDLAGYRMGSLNEPTTAPQARDE